MLTTVHKKKYFIHPQLACLFILFFPPPNLSYEIRGCEPNLVERLSIFKRAVPLNLWNLCQLDKDLFVYVYTQDVLTHITGAFEFFSLSFCG